MVISQVAVPRGSLRDYIELTKPRIVVMLLVTALGGMILAESGMPDLGLILLVLGGGALAAGGANALNQCIERDLDRQMSRTQNRPVAQGRIHPWQALTFGIGLNIIAAAMLGALVNPLSAALTLSATLFYVFVYTIGLKKTTTQNVVIGGAAGAFPPMIGWAAVTGSLALAPVYLFVIIFVWTPPHFWALSLLLKDDYSRAGVPMLPVVAGVKETKKSIIRYSIALVATSFLALMIASVDWIYLGAASALGVGFIYYAWRLWQQADIQGAKALYLYSLAYLGLLFLALMIDGALSI